MSNYQQCLKNYNHFFVEQEKYKQNIEVYRVPIIPRGNGNNIMKILNYLSFIFSSIIFLFIRSQKLKYDLIFVYAPSPVIHSLIGVYLKKIKKINKLRSDKKRLFRKSNKVLKPLIPTQYRYSEVFCRLGFNIDLTSHEFPLPKIITENTQNFLSELERGKKKIGIAPFASFTGKIYPLDLMQKVVGFLQNEHYVFLFGNGKYETDILKVWTKAYPNVLGCYVLNSLSS